MKKSFFVFIFLVVACTSKSHGFDPMAEIQLINQNPLWSGATVEVVRPNTPMRQEAMIPLYFNVTMRSGWSKADVLAEMQSVQKIYEQCGVGFSPLVLAFSEISQDYYYQQLEPSYKRRSRFI